MRQWTAPNNEMGNRNLMSYLTHAIIIRCQQSRFISTIGVNHCLTRVVLELGKSR